jgi:23S rRNA (guanosine2251-2'-O)-methyltransferase
MFLYGKNSVFERLKCNPASIRKVYLQTGFDAPHIEKELLRRKIPAVRLSKQSLYKVKRAQNLQGIIAECGQFEYAFLEDCLGQKPQLSFVFLDRVFDPQNLGAIIRILACMGGFALVIPKHKACGVTESALHIACGGENYVPVIKVSNSTNALLALKDKGYWAVGSVVDSGRDISKTDFAFPLCLVLGSEGAGLRYGLMKHLDEKVYIPMRGAALSFNVTIACGICCYEIAKQRVR